jgi:hypothetical protein
MFSMLQIGLDVVFFTICVDAKENTVLIGNFANQKFFQFMLYIAQKIA